MDRFVKGYLRNQTTQVRIQYITCILHSYLLYTSHSTFLTWINLKLDQLAPVWPPPSQMDFWPIRELQSPFQWTVARWFNWDLRKCIIIFKNKLGLGFLFLKAALSRKGNCAVIADDHLLYQFWIFRGLEKRLVNFRCVPNFSQNQIGSI